MRTINARGMGIEGGVAMISNVNIHLPTKLHRLPIFELNKDFTLRGYTVPAGFRTDGASIPWLFRRWFPAVHAYMPAAIIHDHGCVVANKANSYRCRRRADRLFLDNCLALPNVSNVTALFLYVGASAGSLMARVRY